jgi:transcriptional regulator
MYVPRHFSVSDFSEIAAFVDAAGAADLVTFDGTKPVATLLPVIWDRPADEPESIGEPKADDREAAGQPEAAGDFGRLLGHIALANPQWQTAQPGALALAIVHGPQAYLSPSWYESTSRHGRMVPTWNYQAVHFTGTLTIQRNPEWLRAMVTRLTRRYEDFRPQPWSVEDAPPQYINGQLRAIVGVEMAITTVEAKYKLGQNRNALDQAGAVAGLRGEPGPGPAAIADLMAELTEAAEPD